MIFPMV